MILETIKGAIEFAGVVLKVASITILIIACWVLSIFLAMEFVDWLVSIL
jgi:hypothetical protein